VAVLNLFEAMRKHNPERAKPYNPSAPITLWNTIYFLADITGTITNINLKLCRNKRDAVRAESITDIEHEDHRAPAQTIEVVKAQERATKQAPTWIDRYYASSADTPQELADATTTTNTAPPSLSKNTPTPPN